MADKKIQGVQRIITYLQESVPPIPNVSKITRCGLKFTNRVAIITGGANGIGEGCAEVFVDAGAKVMIGDIDAEAGNRVAESLSRKGPGRCIFEPCDVREPDQIQAIIDKAVGIFGRLDCLFNNAGHNLPFRPFCETAVDEVTELLRTNFISQFVACQHALPHLRVTKGSIINMSSCTAQLGQKGNAVYAATKGAVSAFTKSLALEEAAHGVRVNAVLPGSIYTDGRRRFIESQGEQGLETERLAESLQPMGRSGTPQEAGQVVLFLASEAASFLTGVELFVSGGIELGVGIKHPWLLV